MSVRNHRALPSESPLHRLLRLTAYVITGLILVFVILYVCTLIPEQSRPAKKWVALAAMTVYTFGYPLQSFRRFWVGWRFWCLWAAFLAIHIVAFVIILQPIETFGLLWYVIVAPFEWWCMDTIFDIAGCRRKEKVRQI